MDEDDECLRDERFIAWVAKASRRVRRIVSICTGSFILAEAGVLDGRRATTHWCACDDFRRRYPKVTLVPDPIYVRDGHVYTSAGATSGMDLAIALVEEDFGTELARRVAQGLVMFLRRPGNQAQFSVQVATEVPDAGAASEIQSYIFDHLEGDLRVEALARRFGMSPRNFTRTFTRRVGMGPGRYVEQCRLERARQFLEETVESLSAIASRCGYATPDGLRLAFERNLGVAPSAYRRRFASSSPASSVKGAAIPPRLPNLSHESRETLGERCVLCISTWRRAQDPSRLRTSPAGTRGGRVRPWIALRSLMQNLRDNEDTAAGARFVYALQGKTTERLFPALSLRSRRCAHPY